MTGDESISTDEAPPPVGAYPHARRVGDLLILSGIGPRPADGGGGSAPVGAVAKQQEVVPPGPATNVCCRNGGASGKVVADMEDRLLVGGPHFIIDTGDLG